MGQAATRDRPLESRYFRTILMLFKDCRRCSSILPGLWNFEICEPVNSDFGGPLNGNLAQNAGIYLSFTTKLHQLLKELAVVQ